MASERYNAPVREKHWQQVWNEKGTFRTKDKSKKPKRYQLEMFPYPSGRIHMGHVRSYTLGDVMARYMRAKGFNVLHPMGWDAFGLPAENAAMERKVHPRKWTYENIDTMRGQLKAMGLSIDWEREFATCNPDYYVHQQRLFLDFLKKKLAYRKTAKVNWDPVENTVLANEQVIDGRGWRSGAVVEQRDLTQWFFKITAYRRGAAAGARRPARPRGRISCAPSSATGSASRPAPTCGSRWKAASCRRSCSTLEVFTTRHDTIFGASFMAISPEHPLAAHLAKKNKELAGLHRGVPQDRHHRGGAGEGREEGLRHRHRRRASVQAGREAAGLRRQLHRHGLRHRRHLRLPGPRPARPRFRPQIWASGGAGGAAARGRSRRRSASMHEAYVGEGTMINSEFLDGLTIEAAKDKIAGLLEERGIGERKVNYRMRDWLLSRQRYWGCPIPVIHCEKDGIVPVPVEELPVQLPEDVTFDKPGNPLDHHPTWKHVTCPKCGARRRARDRHHGYLRRQLLVPVPLHGAERADADRQEGAEVLGAGRPVHRRQGARGAAPAVRALLHARHEGDQARHVRRAVHVDVHAGHRRARDLPQRERRLADARPRCASRATAPSRKAFSIATGRPVEIGPIEKMSKSRKNVVDPDDIIAHYGADTARLFIVSDSPPDRDIIWTEAGVAGAGRQVQRISRLIDEVAAKNPAARRARPKPANFGPEAQALRRAAHKTLNSVSQNIEGLRYNVAVAQLYELTHALSAALDKSGEGLDWAIREAAELFVQMIGPMLPHLAEDCWERLGYNTLLADQPWPEAEPALLVDDEITIAVQVNGKRRDELTIARTATKAEVEAAALKLETVARALEGRSVTRVIVVPQRIVNVVG